MSFVHLVKSLNRRLKSWFEVPRPYSSAYALIRRAEKRMKTKPLCPFCQTAMMFRLSTIENGMPYRDDQNWKCNHCFHSVHFGLPITKEEYEEEFALRGGKHLMRPTYRFDERDQKEVLERLKALGYVA